MATRTLEVTRPTMHKGQREVLEHPARFRVLACGRRWGKTRLGAWLCVETSITGKRAWWIAPSYPVASIGWRLIKTLAKQFPGVAVRETERLIDFPEGGWLQVKSADNPDSLRGEGLDLAVFDECAFIKEEAWTEAVRPALADRRGRAVFISTPKGRNWFWRAYQLGLDPLQPDWCAWNFPTSASPFITPDEIASARDLLPDRLFRQEFLSEFIEDSGGVFRGVADVSTAAPANRVDGHDYVIGLDWARDVDYTAVSVIDRTTKTEVWIERFNQVSWNMQRQFVRTVYDKYQPQKIYAEANSIGGPNIEALQADGMRVEAFTTTAESKGPLIESLALAVERHEITLVNDLHATAELQAYELERLPSGRFRYGAPDGMHDDTVIARALAWYGVINRSGAWFA